MSDVDLCMDDIDNITNWHNCHATILPTLQHGMLLTVLLENGICQHEDMHEQSRSLDSCQAV